MALITVAGPVSNMMQETEVTRAVTHGGGVTGNSASTSFQQKKVLNFRVGNKPVTMELGKTIDLADGDNATVVGTDSSGITKAVAVRNDATNIIYFRYSPMTLFVWAGILIVLGIPATGILIGFVMIPMGIWLGYKGMQTKNAIAQINASAPSVSEATSD